MNKEKTLLLSLSVNGNDKIIKKKISEFKNLTDNTGFDHDILSVAEKVCDSDLIVVVCIKDDTIVSSYAYCIGGVTPENDPVIVNTTVIEE